MKNNYLFLLMNQIILIFSSIPTWDINGIAIELYPSTSTFSSNYYPLYDKDGYVLNKKVTKNSDGTLSAINELTYNSKTQIVEFNDIESKYENQLGCTHLICPKGNFHPYDFDNGVYIKSFNEEGNWELSCYRHNTGYFLIFYAHNGNKALYWVKGNNQNINAFSHFTELYGYKLPEYQEKEHNYEYKLPSIQKDEGGNLTFSGYNLIMNSGECQINKNQIQGYTIITEAKSDTQGSIDSDNNFYFFTYNNVNDFSSGYSNNAFDINDGVYANSFSIHLNDKSPLNFIDNVEIKEMKFIPGTRFVYYKIYNTNKDTIYYGFIDIKLNKVLYNIEAEDTMKFIPLENGYEMLALTSTKLYRVCMVNPGDSCDNTCTTIMLDPEGNKCQENCVTGKIRLMPEGICIRKELCDENIYVLNEDETECGLCNYFYPNDKKYKLINTPGCLSDIPNNVEYYNPQWFLYKCKTNYHLYNNKCEPDTCYVTCQTCSEISDDATNQKCLTCISGYELVNGNCIIIPTTIIIPAPTTIIQSTLITKEELEPCINKKCLKCDKGSNNFQLCLSCNDTLYEKVNYTNKYSKYVDCFEKKQLEEKYYYDNITNQYKPCYKSCKKCLGPGNATHHNCLECDNNYMFRPGNNQKNNCVVFSEYYYLSSYGEYKPMSNPQCPEEAKYRIIDDNNKTSCIYDCKADEVYKYLYNGNCLKNCSEVEGTENRDFICIETDPNKIYISENPIYLDNNDSIDILQTLAITYAKEFNYTDKHISLYTNKDTTVALYKNVSIGETKLKLPNIDFGECYNKVINYYNITSNKLITGIVEKKDKINPSTFYLFFHPETGLKLEIREICKNDTIEVKENLLSMLDETKENYELQISLTKQGINIFDLNDPFYKDICYDFNNPKNRDIPLKDRIKETYVNAVLCDDGCINTGIDINNNVATCNCKFNDVTNNDLIHENAALEYLVGELFDLINSSNIQVLKCYKYIFRHFKRSLGGIIILILFLSFITFSFIFFFYELTNLKKYIFLLTENFISFITKYPTFDIFFPPKRNDTNSNKNNHKILNFFNHLDDKNNKHKRNNSKSTKTLNPISNSKQELNTKELVIYNKNKLKSNMPKEKQIIENQINVLDNEKQIKKYFKEYLSTSPDDMEFDDAIKLDKRSFFSYLLDSLKENQSLAYTFFASDKINTRMIKFILFVLNINLYFIVNGLFYSEAYISELYHINEENETFFSFIPRTLDNIIYTSIVAVFINYLTEFFFLNENKIKGIFKREINNRVVLKQNIFLLIKEIQNRYISFIIIALILFLFSLYYILCFNYVYPRTQIEWIKSSILIIIVMQFLSFLKCLCETIFRYLSFKCESEKLFKISKIFKKD